MRSLCASLSREYEYERLRVLMGVMNDKNHRKMIRMLSPLVHEYVFCRADTDRSQDPWVLQAFALGLGCKATVVESVAQGFQDVLRRAGRDDLVCVTGSLFVVGEVLAHLEKNPLQQDAALT
jgi:dihydrofolate synthase/folylpolyglutamate synthase